MAEGSQVLVPVGLSASQRLPSCKLKLTLCGSAMAALHASAASPLVFRLMRTEPTHLIKCLL